MKKFLAAGIAIVLSLGTLFWQSQPDGKFHVYFLNVGQGDSILLRTPSGKNILIDGGPDDKVLSELKDTLPFFDSTLDYVLLTHPDSDHIKGLIYVLKRYPVKNIYFTGAGKNNSLTESFLQTVRDKNIHTVIADATTDIVLTDGVTLDVLYPFTQIMGSAVNINSTSIVSRAIYGNNSILLTGDSENDVAEKLITNHANLDSDILKVAHHGSKYASSEKFLSAVSPKYCVIQVGKDNSYHHPHLETLKRLDVACEKILRTDKNGRIEFTF
jgi:competence protein ComEC